MSLSLKHLRHRQGVGFAVFLSLSKDVSASGGLTGRDFDGGGDVEFTDFLLLSANHGKSATSVTAVQKPAAVILFVIGFVGCLRQSMVAVG